MSEINKLGIIIAGKLFVFRRVSKLRVIKLKEDEYNKYVFEIKIRKNKEWKTENVECEGKIVFKQEAKQ